MNQRLMGADKRHRGMTAEKKTWSHTTTRVTADTKEPLKHSCPVSVADVIDSGLTILGNYRPLKERRNGSRDYNADR